MKAATSRRRIDAVAVTVRVRRFMGSLLCAAALASVVHAADERGFIGIGIAVDADGWFLNPTLNWVKISTIQPVTARALT